MKQAVIETLVNEEDCFQEMGEKEDHENVASWMKYNELIDVAKLLKTGGGNKKPHPYINLKPFGRNLTI